uniref:Folate/biopterin transporter n=1 Tax=Aureoumbra lagunensis TaxID=44058 RepID=A0A7S3JUW7_9STRA|mmetsp:Transcript_14039/g.18735  ORF Transcript_14039/g.18735 Transcript_14039/m.18735 type:complete len:642 (+) Transcript_14039:173-2098(+)
MFVFIPIAAIKSYFSRLINSFGWKYVAIIICIYGLNQGVGEAVLFTAQRYYYFDVLKTSAKRYTQISGFTNIPWQIKAMYGMLSDSVSIYGLRRTPYCIGAGILGTISALFLWLLGAGVNLSSILLVFANLSIASPDVMIDATAAEKAKIHPKLTADLQALCWGSLYFCSFFAEMATGLLVDPKVLGPQHLFGVFIITSCANLLPSSFGWLGEKRLEQQRRYAALSETEQDTTLSVGINPLHNSAQSSQTSTTIITTATNSTQISKHINEKDKQIRKLIFFAAVSTCSASVAIGLVQMFYSGPDSTAVEGGITVALGSVLALALYYILYRVSPPLAGTAVYIFLSGAFQPLTDVIFDWSHDDGEKNGNCAKHCDQDDDNCGWAQQRNYPCISSQIYGTVRALAQLFGFVGVVIFNSFFKRWAYQKIYFLGQTVYFAVNLLDLVWVSRLNLRLGISDKMFLLGADIITPIVSKLHVMPMFILAARLCPPNVEGTVFALLMSLSNFGNVVGSYNGAGLLSIFGGVHEPEFRHLTSFVFVRTLIFLVPIFIIPCLIPKGAPDDDTIFHEQSPTEQNRQSSTTTSSEIELAPYSVIKKGSDETSESTPSSSVTERIEGEESKIAQTHEEDYDEFDLEVAADVVLL